MKLIYQLKKRIKVLVRRAFEENRLHIRTVDGVYCVSSSNNFSGSKTLLTSAALRNIISASSSLPFLNSHLGDSGIIL